VPKTVKSDNKYIILKYKWILGLEEIDQEIQEVLEFLGLKINK
jgi:hypothetical protein